jgi:hypothetical protein
MKVIQLISFFSYRNFSFIQGVLCLHNESTYKLLQAVGQMYEFLSTSKHHDNNLRNCLVLIGSNLNQEYLIQQFRKCIT